MAPLGGKMIAWGWIVSQIACHRHPAPLVGPFPPRHIRESPAVPELFRHRVLFAHDWSKRPGPVRAGRGQESRPM
jgi:hypothetical protein